MLWPQRTVATIRCVCTAPDRPCNFPLRVRRAGPSSCRPAATTHSAGAGTAIDTACNCPARARRAGLSSRRLSVAPARLRAGKVRQKRGTNDRAHLRGYEQNRRFRSPQGLRECRPRKPSSGRTIPKAWHLSVRFWNERGHQLRRPYESHSEIALPTITMMTMAKPISSHGMSLRSRGVTRPSSYCGLLLRCRRP